MVYMISRRRLEDGDFEAWLTRFEQGATARKDAGCLGVRRFQGAEDPQELCVIFEWESIEKAKAFVAGKIAEKPELLDQREQGGGLKLENIFMTELPSLAS